MGELLDKQYQFFLKNEEMLMAKYKDKFIVIHDERIIDTFNSERDAYIYCVQHYQIGTFFIRQANTVHPKEI